LSLNRNEKAAVVSEVAAQAGKSQTLAIAEYRGLTVEALNKLRIDARSRGVYLHVLKNTLARRAVAGTPFEPAAELMVGPLIYGFSEDAVAAAKVVADFAKSNDKLVLKGGRLQRQGPGRRQPEDPGLCAQQGSLAVADRRFAQVARAAYRCRAGGPGGQAWRGRRSPRRCLSILFFQFQSFRRSPKWHSIKTLS
jgi:ribosomal protein L10